MAEVWLAEDQRLGRWVAVKVLRDGVTAGNEDDLAHNFEREARVVARLQHPNIVGVYDAGRVDGRQYIVMEYIHGYSLRQILDAQGRLDQADAVRYGQQIASALQYAHEQGVVHCDIKPENILITEEGVPKLADFGVAETISRTLSPSEARAILGTIAYLAPEVLQGAPANPRSDVYSLAMTLYEAVAGRLPFAGTNPAAVAGQRLATPAPPLRTFARDVSPGLEATLAGGLAVSELDRFPSAREFGIALQRSLSGAAPSTVVTSAALPRPAPPPGPARSRYVTTRVAHQPRPANRSTMSGATLGAIIGIILIAAGLGGFGAWLLARNDDTNGSGVTTPTPRTVGNNAGDGNEPAANGGGHADRGRYSHPDTGDQVAHGDGSSHEDGCAYKDAHADEDSPASVAYCHASGDANAVSGRLSPALSSRPTRSVG